MPSKSICAPQTTPGAGRQIYRAGRPSAMAAGPSRAAAEFGSAAASTRPEFRSNHEVGYFRGRQDPSSVRGVSLGGSICPLLVLVVGVPGHLPGGKAAARVWDHYLNAVTGVRVCGRAGRL